MPSAAALGAAGLAPVVLEAKEGLALINGTQLMTAVGALALAEVTRLVAGRRRGGCAEPRRRSRAPTWPSIRASTKPAPTRDSKPRRATCRKLLAGSLIRESHRDCGKVQDAYSLRCMPQVHGAARDALAYVARTIEVEMNAATDNPHGVRRDGRAALRRQLPRRARGHRLRRHGHRRRRDSAAISERRTERLVNPALSGLPAFLTAKGGLESGLMIAHVTAAALASENKVLCHPASVDSIPTSANKEDHVSMGVTAARKAARVVTNTRRILAVELLAACQALDLLLPLASSPALEGARAAARRCVPARAHDRMLSPEIEALADLLQTSALAKAAEAVCGRLE